MRQIKFKGKKVSKPPVDPNRKTAWHVHFGTITVGPFENREAAEKYQAGHPGGRLWLDYETLDPVKRYMVIDDCRRSYKSLLVATSELAPGTVVLDRKTGETHTVQPVTNVRTYNTYAERNQRRQLPDPSRILDMPSDINACIPGQVYRYTGTYRHFTLDGTDYRLRFGDFFTMPERK